MLTVVSILYSVTDAHSSVHMVQVFTDADSGVHTVQVLLMLIAVSTWCRC